LWLFKSCQAIGGGPKIPNLFYRGRRLLQSCPTIDVDGSKVCSFFLAAMTTKNFLVLADGGWMFY
jgi:hypothetical protein